MPSQTSFDVRRVHQAVAQRNQASYVQVLARLLAVLKKGEDNLLLLQVLICFL